MADDSGARAVPAPGSHPAGHAASGVDGASRFDPSRIAELAERVKAYEPRKSLDNRADEMPLDLAIAQAVGVAGSDWQVARGSVTGYFSGDGKGGFGNPTVPRYTRSLDDALTLTRFLPGLLSLEGGWEPDLPEVWPAWSLRWYPRGTSGNGWHGEVQTAATPALALCVTALHAIARDRDASLAEDAKRLSPEGVAARAEGIAHD